MITELNVNYLAYFTLHWTCVVILHKGIFPSVEIQFHRRLLPCTHFYSILISIDVLVAVILSLYQSHTATLNMGLLLNSPEQLVLCMLCMTRDDRAI